MAAKFAKVMTPKFRVSFPQVFEPKGFPGQEPKYSVGILIPKTLTDPKDAEAFKKLKALMAETVKEKWPNEAQRPKKLINPIKDGDTDVMEDGTLRCEKYPEIRGHYFITASSKQKPGVVDKNLNPIMDKTEFYSGCWALATLTCFAYGPSKERPQSKSGVGFGLQNVMKVKDDQPFSGRARAEDDFAEFKGVDLGEGATVSAEAEETADMFA